MPFHPTGQTIYGVLRLVLAHARVHARHDDRCAAEVLDSQRLHPSESSTIRDSDTVYAGTSELATSAATNSDAERVQIELLREAGPVRRVEAARSLTATVITLARSAIRRCQPTATDEEILLEFAAIHYGPDLAARLRRYLARRAGKRTPDPAPIARTT